MIVLSSMNRGAIKFLKKLKFILVKRYGEKVRAHFKDPATQPNYTKKKSFQKAQTKPNIPMMKKWRALFCPWGLPIHIQKSSLKE